MISNPSRRAFTLVEMLIVIGIIAIAMVVEARVFYGTMQAIQTSNVAENQINSLNRMSSMLRRDVWSAVSVEIPDNRTIVLSRPDGATARWQLSDAEVIRGTGTAQTPLQQTWKVSLPLHARREGATIVLYAMPSRESAGTEMRFLSQVMLAKGTR